MSNPRDLNIVTEIKKRHGSVLDLDASPMLIIEIIHNFRHLLDEVAGPDGTAGAPGGSPAPPSPPAPAGQNPGEVGIAAVLNLLLELRSEIRELPARIQLPATASAKLP